MAMGTTYLPQRAKGSHLINSRDKTEERSSPDHSLPFRHSRLRSSKKKTRICCVESSKLVQSCQRKASFTVYNIHGHRHYI